MSTLIFVVLVLAIGLFMLMSLCKGRDEKLITKLYILLAIGYFIVGHRLIHFLMVLFVFDNTNWGTAFIEIMVFSSLYLSMVLSALFGLLYYLKDRPMMLEFAKSFTLLLVMFPIRLMFG